MVAFAGHAAAQPVHAFRSSRHRPRVGSIRSAAASVVRLIEDMFLRINRAFNYDGRLRAVYDFRVDWDAFYIYDGVSADEVRKPHPDHDYLVVMDLPSPTPVRAAAGMATEFRPSIIRVRTTTWFNSPFEKKMPSTASFTSSAMPGSSDIYAMKVDAGQESRERRGVSRCAAS